MNFNESFAIQSSQSKDLILKNAHIIDPANGYNKEHSDLIIKDRKIVDYGVNLANNIDAENAYDIIDCKNHVVCPGIIDMQVHFRDPGFTHKEDIITGSKSAAAGGITSVVCQPNTNPVLDTDILVDYVQNKAKTEGYINAYVYGAITKAMGGKELTEMSAMKAAGAVGFTDDGLPVMDSLVMRRALEYAKTIDSFIAQHAEDLNLTNKGCMTEGYMSNKLGVTGIPNQSESIIVERDISLVELTKARYHLLHISTKESLEAIKRAKDKGLPVTCEITPHHFLLNESALENYNTNAKMNPPLRSEEDRLILVDAMKSGLIDAIATDHAPHTELEKDAPLEKAPFGIIGLETMLPASLQLYHDGILTLERVVTMMTSAPEKILNLNRGTLSKGSVADITIFDPNYKWNCTKDLLHSKSFNTPFLNREFKGKNLLTIVNGTVVYRNHSLI